MANDYYLLGLLIQDSFVSLLNNLIIVQSPQSNKGVKYYKSLTHASGLVAYIGMCHAIG